MNRQKCRLNDKTYCDCGRAASSISSRMWMDEDVVAVLVSSFLLTSVCISLHLNFFYFLSIHTILFKTRLLGFSVPLQKFIRSSLKQNLKSYLSISERSDRNEPFWMHSKTRRRNRRRSTTKLRKERRKRRERLSPNS